MARDLQYFINRMIYWCRDVSLGYDQSNRQDFRDGRETDCSALVIHALQETGFDTGAASYTGNMRTNLVSKGWKVVTNNGNPQAGDILLNDVHHVAVYIGHGQLAQASIDERGRASGGKGGDQTGHETNIRSYYNYPWDCYLRYGGGSSKQSVVVSSGKLSVDGSWGAATTRAIQAYLNKIGYHLSVDGSRGPATVRAIQQALNAKLKINLAIDGSMGPATVKALQRLLGTTQDGVISTPSQMVKALQRVLNSGKQWL